MATPTRWFSHNNNFYPLFDVNSFNQQIDWATAMAPLIKSVVTSLLFRSHGNTQETSLHQLDLDWNDSSSSTHTRSCSMWQYYWHQQSSSFPLGNNSQDGNSSPLFANLRAAKVDFAKEILVSDFTKEIIRLDWLTPLLCSQDGRWKRGEEAFQGFY